MSAFLLLVSLFTLAAGGLPAPTQHSWDFEQDKVGSVPWGFTASAGDWKITEHTTAPSPTKAVAQTAKSGSSVFNVILAVDTNYRDLDMTVRMLPLAGAIDQGGGLLWRARDARNYYIARYNPLEDNFRVYKVENGRRTQLASADVPRRDGWLTLRVVMRGDAIECFLDGKRYLEVHDATFTAAGKIGLWTKADAQSLFDNLVVASLN